MNSFGKGLGGLYQDAARDAAREVEEQAKMPAEVRLPATLLTELCASTTFTHREIQQFRRYYPHLTLDAFTRLVKAASANPAILYRPEAYMLRRST